jgi:hypothetical protein
MERIMKKLFLVTTLIFLLLTVTAQCKDSQTGQNREEFDRIFNEVARNFGAVEAAFYTFGVEFERVPGSLQEMIDTGHLRVKWANPYTGEPVQQTHDKTPGDISWQIAEDDPYIVTSAFYTDLRDSTVTRWMTKTIWIYTHEELRKWVFGDDAPREEKLVRVYCLQFEDAIESFRQRFGRLPETHEELAEGDVNVAYINPITAEVVKNSEQLSPGDFWYRKLDDDHFAIVGWGNDEPVYFLSNDRDYDEFIWEGEALESTRK